jgi:hypothetical protein
MLPVTDSHRQFIAVDSHRVFQTHQPDGKVRSTDTVHYVRTFTEAYRLLWLIHNESALIGELWLGDLVGSRAVTDLVDLMLEWAAWSPLCASRIYVAASDPIQAADMTRRLTLCYGARRVPPIVDSDYLQLPSPIAHAA